MALTVSIMTGGANSHPTTSEEANGLATDFVLEGIIGAYTNTGGVAPTTGAFSINAQGTPDMTVAVGSGVAYVQGTPSSQNSQMFRVYNSASTNVTISANASGSTKYDWLYIKLDATLLNAPTLAGTTTATLVTSRSTSAGTDDGTPPTYGWPIAVITVANGASSITNSVIRDLRTNASIGASTGASTGWTDGVLPAVSSVTNNGNRSYNVTFASTVAPYLTPGMRVRLTRTVAAPTYMGGLFNGTNHYFTKVTCTSTLSTVTDNFTIMGFAEPTAYGGYLCGRSDAASNNGIGLAMNSSGQIQVVVFNGGVANFKSYTTYQSLPLNKKTHIAVTWATGVAVIYFDGVAVPALLASGGTAPNTAGTGGDFSIGRHGAFGSYFAGYLSGFGAFNAVLTAATIRSYIPQILSGSETNCIGAWSLNNTGVNQQAAGTNDLTATNSVSYTVRSPYATDATGTAGGSLDYGIVTKVATTVATIQVPEGNAIPTSGGVSAVAYAVGGKPFGMPMQKDKWVLNYVFNTSITSQNLSAGVWSIFLSGLTLGMNIPIGSWVYGYRGGVQMSAGGVASSSIHLALTTAAPSNSVYSEKVSSWGYNASAQFSAGMHLAQGEVSLSTATQYNLYTTYDQGTATVTCLLRGDLGVFTIFAECAYL